jgi:mutual gliding-motility protein MglA
VQLEPGARELTIKLVYYGPGLGGKTTNLAMLHERLQPDARGQIVTLETADDRTLFFDMLPLMVGGRGGDNYHMQVKVFTVPGQPIHASARRLVLGGADGVAFIADSRLTHVETNAQSFSELRENLHANDMPIDEIPLVIQFNKRDLPKIRPDEELHSIAAQSREMVFPAIAARGVGVAETFMALFHLTWRALDQRHGLSERFGVREDLAVEQVGSLLGVEEPIDQLLRTRFGYRATVRKGA